MPVYKRKYRSGKVVWYYQFALSGSTRQNQNLVTESGFATKQEAIDAEAVRRAEIGETAGSGWKILIERNEAWKKAQGRTARGIFSSFCDALESGEDPQSAGPPQLVALYPSFGSRLFGIVWRNQRYLAGSLAPDAAHLNAFEWRNCLFERVDPHTMRRLAGAQPQPRPTIL